MATTTNFGWETPDDTDLVKDGAAAMRTLGSAIDTSLVDLKGGTTGQVLSKASNTDMDFTWTAVDPLVILDAKGDLISATAADTPARLAVGTNGQVLTADSTAATGLKWASPSTGGSAHISTLSPSAVATINADNVFNSTYDNYKIEIMVEQSANATLYMQLRSGGSTLTTTTYIFDSSVQTPFTGQTGWTISDNVGAGNHAYLTMNISRPALAAKTFGSLIRMADDNQVVTYGLINTNATAYDGFLLGTSAGTMTGKIRIYGLVN